MYIHSVGLSVAPEEDMNTPSLTASVITGFCALTIALNVYVCIQIYRKRHLRDSNTSLIVANLACVDILVSLKDLPYLYGVSTTGQWYFEEHWCHSYGLTNVIFIIVSVSSLVTVTTERYLRIAQTKVICQAAEHMSFYNPTNRAILLGYVIAHTTLSYSLSLLWSKYVFISRKAFCEVTWPPSGMMYTFFASLIFLLPVSLLIYNLFKENDDPKPTQGAPKKNTLVFNKDGTSEVLYHSTGEQDATNNDDEPLEKEAHTHFQSAIALFLVSWAPYVIEGIFSDYSNLPNIPGVISAFIPIVITTLLPYFYLKCVSGIGRWKQKAATINF